MVAQHCGQVVEKCRVRSPHTIINEPEENSLWPCDCHIGIGRVIDSHAKGRCMVYFKVAYVSGFLKQTQRVLSMPVVVYIVVHHPS